MLRAAAGRGEAVSSSQTAAFVVSAAIRMLSRRQTHAFTPGHAVFTIEHSKLISKPDENWMYVVHLPPMDSPTQNRQE